MRYDRRSQQVTVVGEFTTYPDFLRMPQALQDSISQGRFIAHHPEFWLDGIELWQMKSSNTFELTDCVYIAADDYDLNKVKAVIRKAYGPLAVIND